MEKRSLPEKLFGVFDHRVLKPSSPLFRGFDDQFWVPHSRNTTVDRVVELVPEMFDKVTGFIDQKKAEDKSGF